MLEIRAHSASYSTMRSEDLNPRRTPPPAAGIFDHDDMAPQRENELLLPVSQAVSSQVGPATGVT